LIVSVATVVVMPQHPTSAQSQPTGSSPTPAAVRFEDVTAAAGIRFRHERAASVEKLYPETLGAGVAWLDADQDGWLDALFVNSGYTPLFRPPTPPQPALFRSNGDRTFSDVTAASGLKGDGTFYMGVAVGDYDNDGYPDVYFTGYRQSTLFHNRGNGTFEDVTATAAVANAGVWGTAAGFFDADNDGWLDLLVTNYVQYDIDNNVVCGDARPGFRAYCHPDSFPGTSMKLYRNLRDGRFADVTAQAGLVNTDGKSLGVVMADLNGDGRIDVFVANDTQRNFLYFNDGDGTFTDVTYESGAGFSEDGKTEAGMSADAADIDGNGTLDLFVSHLDQELDRLYYNNGDGTFTDATIVSGIGQTNILNSAFGARFFDYDNDGWRDLLVVNGHILDNIPLYHPGVTHAEVKKLYLNLGKGRFADVTNAQPESFRSPRVGRGLAVGDYGEDAQLFENRGGNDRHWLGVRLIGRTSNRDGTGARLVVTSGPFVSHDQAKGGMSYISAQDPRIYFGLGDRTHVDSVEVLWPSGTRTVLKDVKVDQLVTVTEGQ
jgi:hypothetical protein